MGKEMSQKITMARHHKSCDHGGKTSEPKIVRN